VVNYDQKAILENDECSRTQRPSGNLLLSITFLFVPLGRATKSVSSSKLLDRKCRRLSEAEDCVLVLWDIVRKQRNVVMEGLVDSKLQVIRA
jgi:hypothetical protein